ncbi:MAG TPA: FAD-binding protein, partial [Thermomicrobiaceae bacterium]|nr:FAD-binding protein [Thermomicrobiaceae bacterium]
MSSIGQTLANYWDVIVVGGGNAGFCAAHAARELVPRVLILEKAPAEWAGGNSYFTAGAMRVAHNGLDDLSQLVPGLTPEQLTTTDIPAYPESAFLDDMFRVTEGRTRPDLARLIVGESLATARWLKTKGIHWRLQYDRQSFLVDGRHRFWGNLPLGVQGGGVSLMDQHLAAARAGDIQIAYDSGVVGFIQRPGGA